MTISWRGWLWVLQTTYKTPRPASPQVKVKERFQYHHLWLRPFVKLSLAAMQECWNCLQHPLGLPLTMTQLAPWMHVPYSRMLASLIRQWLTPTREGLSLGCGIWDGGVYGSPLSACSPPCSGREWNNISLSWELYSTLEGALWSSGGPSVNYLPTCWSARVIYTTRQTISCVKHTV